jgi:hypothetical protein
MIENMTTHLLQVSLLVITQTKRLGAAGQEFDAFSAVEGWLTGFAMAALIISLILVFYLSASHKRSLDSFRSQIAELKAHIEELWQHIAEFDQQAPGEASVQKLTEESEELVAIQNS